MKSVIVCTSVSHGNTRRVAEAMGQVLEAPVVEPGRVDPVELSTCDLVGFGSGIFRQNFHPWLRRFVHALPPRERGRAFVFATRGLPEPPWLSRTPGFVRLLEHKGFEVAGTFSCRGFDTWFPFRLVGGIGRGRPGATELAAAREFAEGLRPERTAGSDR